MPEARLLVVDDEATIVELLSASLTFQGFEVLTSTDGATALALAKKERPDVIITDVMMPRSDGFEFVRKLRAEGFRMPALFLTARDSVADRVAGLTLGGDDYIAKPFSLAEVIARVRVALRRSEPGSGNAEPDTLRYADIEIDERAYQVRKAGVLVELSPTEFRLLSFLVENAETVISKARILDHVWEYDFNGDAHIVETYMSYLRKKIDTGEVRLLHTVRGVGYVLRRRA